MDIDILVVKKGESSAVSPNVACYRHKSYRRSIVVQVDNYIGLGQVGDMSILVKGIVKTDDLFKYSYVGSVCDRDNNLSVYVFERLEDVVMIEPDIRDESVKAVWGEKYVIEGNKYYCLEGSTYCVVDRFVMIQQGSYKGSYLFDQDKLIDKFDCSIKFLRNIFDKKIKMTYEEAMKDLEIVRKLIKVKKYTDRLGRYNIANILNGSTYVSIEEIQRLIYSDKVKERVIAGENVVYFNFDRVLARAQQMQHTNYDLGLLEKYLELITIELKYKEIVFYVACQHWYHSARFVEDRVYNCIRYNGCIEEEARRYVYDFIRKNSLSSTGLSNAAIEKWARLIKKLSSNQIVDKRYK